MPFTYNDKFLNIYVYHINLKVIYMYDFFIGKVITISESYVILEVNNIGYKIYLTNNCSVKLNYFIKLYIYNYVSDSINYLYGFINKLDRDLFIKLLEVKKIGVKSAFNILKKYSAEELFNLVACSEEDEILKIPKITKDNYKSFIQKLLSFKFENSLNINAEFLSILRSLEYSDKDIFKVYKKINIKNDINEQVKEAIRFLEGDINE